MLPLSKGPARAGLCALPALAAALALSAGCRGDAGRPPALHNDPQALSYRSRAKVTDADARQILAQSVGTARSRAAWAESLHVHAADGPIGDGADKYLFGEARLFLVEYESSAGKFREVDARDDAAMARADAGFLFALLGRWSREHGIAWDVRLGTQRGRIDAAGPDAKAREILAGLGARCGCEGDGLEALRVQLDRKYRDRRE